MNFTPSDAQSRLRTHYFEFAQENLNDDVVDRIKHARFELPLWRLCGQEGIQGLPVPECYGGMGVGALDMIFALEGLAHGCEDGGLMFAMAAQLFACNIPILLHGSSQQKSEYLPGLCNGEFIATNAMTEKEGGSAAFQMNSRAIKSDAGYLLSGVKSYCGNAPVADLCLVYVLTDPDKGFFGGVSAFLLDKRRHDFVVTVEVEKMGLRTCLTGKVCIDAVTAADGDLLGKVGSGGFIFNQSMDWERIGMSALSVGTMTRLLERAVVFAKKRRPGGVAISKHQAIAHTLVDMQADLDACKLLVYQSAWHLGEGTRVSRDAATTKLFVSEKFKAMTIKLMQIYASEGFHADSEIGRSLNDSLASTLYSGTSEIQKNIIAGWMGL